MSTEQGPSEAAFRRVEALYTLLSGDPAFARVRRLMEVDWSEADTTVEEVGLPPLLYRQAHKLRALAEQLADGLDWSDAANAIRYTERHDALARDALWWLGELNSDPLLQRRAAPVPPAARRQPEDTSGR